MRYHRPLITAALAAAVTLTACSLPKPEPPVPPAPVPQKSAFHDSIGHRSWVKIEDVTDPAAPRLVYAAEGNAISGCGVFNIMALLVGKTTMGPSLGSAGLIGSYCTGFDQGGHQRVPAPFNLTNVNVFIGNIQATECIASGNPVSCCTGSGTGCSISLDDLTTFAENQPNGTLTGQPTNYNNWLSGGAHGIALNGLDAEPSFFYDQSGPTIGMNFVSTFDGATGTQRWCEGALRINPGAIGPPGFYPVEIWNGTIVPALYQFNHFVINPCVDKAGGQTWRITITVTLA